MTLALSRRRLQIQAFLIAAVLLVSQNTSTVYHRSCRRLPRNEGWWDLIWNTYSGDRFKKTFHVSRSTFSHSSQIRTTNILRRTISPKCRLPICLCRLGWGDYYYIISEVVGLGQSTVSTIVNELNAAIVTCTWKDCVTAYIPVTEENLRCGWAMAVSI